MVALVSVGISIVFGSLFYAIKLDQPFESRLQNIKPYAQWQQRQDSRLVAPDRGTLIGVIKEINRRENMIVVDLKGSRWTVDITEAKKVSDTPIKVGSRIGIIGEKTGADTFRADQIRAIKQRRAQNR